MADGEASICNLALIKVGATREFIDTLDQSGSEAADILAQVYPQSRDDLLRAFAWRFATRRAYQAPLGGDAWDMTKTYGVGAYANYTPSLDNVVNESEQDVPFVYVSLQANNLNKPPDSSPTFWRLISRAAWAYCYSLPADNLQVQKIYRLRRNVRQDQEVKYVIEQEPPPGPGQILLTDAVMPWEKCYGPLSVPPTIEIVYTALITDTTQYPSDFTTALAWDIAEELAYGLLKDYSKGKACAEMARMTFNIAVANAKRDVRPDLDPLPSHIRARR